MRPHLLIPLLLLAACGPQMRTDYTLTPPASAKGKQCANSCYYVREGCVNTCEYSRHNCPASYGGVGVGVGYVHYRHRSFSGSGIGFGSGFYDDDRSCHFNATACTENCEIQYRQCFTSCGGTVSTTTSCVENCI